MGFGLLLTVSFHFSRAADVRGRYLGTFGFITDNSYPLFIFVWRALSFCHPHLRLCETCLLPLLSPAR